MQNMTEALSSNTSRQKLSRNDGRATSNDQSTQQVESSSSRVKTSKRLDNTSRSPQPNTSNTSRPQTSKQINNSSASQKIKQNSPNKRIHSPQPSTQIPATNRYQANDNNSLPRYESLPSSVIARGRQMLKKDQESLPTYSDLFGAYSKSGPGLSDTANFSVANLNDFSEYAGAEYAGVIPLEYINDSEISTSETSHKPKTVSSNSKVTNSKFDIQNMSIDSVHQPSCFPIKFFGRKPKAGKTTKSKYGAR